MFEICNNKAIFNSPVNVDFLEEEIHSKFWWEGLLENKGER
jgi:hypothetical protein